MSTTQLNPEQTARARKNLHFILSRLASVGGKPVAVAMGCDESTICRMKPDKFRELAEILAVLDLKIVPSEMRCFNERDIEMFIHGSKRWMEHVQGLDQLEEG
ncbi:transcriptional regulator [Pseudomonas tructae]|uniref:Transcriptional regulator n=1 Tax=Pseudomonas tructae TaxID=2518644 RepID=A0A411MK83_9PSED|nr:MULTISPECIES: CII family transcriptional regulator [Pseudomonas]QBF27178.1 transcriptional regulator [Pseudomonas tructae]UVL22411.1 lambda phage CII family protein [Pseudomonas donghuensis]